MIQNIRKAPRLDMPLLADILIPGNSKFFFLAPLRQEMPQHMGNSPLKKRKKTIKRVEKFH